MIDRESEGMKSPKMYSVLSSRPTKVRVSETRPRIFERSVPASQCESDKLTLSENIFELMDSASFTLLGVIHRS